MAFDFGRFLEKIGLVARDPEPQPSDGRDERRESDHRDRDSSDFGSEAEQPHYDHRSEGRYQGYTRRTVQPTGDPDNMVEFKTARSQPAESAPGNGQQRIVIRYLRSLEDCRDIMLDLLDDMQVVFNIEDCDKETRQRALDIIYGASFALDAKMRPASRDTYIVAPNSVMLNDDRGGDEQRRGGSGYGSNIRSFRS